MKSLAVIASLLLLLGSAAGAETVALTNARVIDGTGSPPQSDRVVLIKDGLISDVFREAERSLPDGAAVVDIGGRVILPGLIDGHVHLLRIRGSTGPAGLADREAALALLLKSGVTAIRELGGDARLSGQLARRQAQGKLRAPRIYYSALLYGPAFLEDPRAQKSQQGMPPGTAPWSRVVSEGNDIVEIVSQAKATGATGIKLYASLDAPLLDALTVEAHRQGMKAWAHSVVFPAGPGDVVSAGADAVIHSRGLIAEGRSDIPDTYSEGTRVWIRQLDFKTDPEAPRFVRLFAEMKARGVMFEPALHADGDPARGPTGDWRDDMREWSCKITGAAHRAGVAISAGTDTPAAIGALQREMERLVECGLSPLDAIRAATFNNASAIGIDRTHGTVEPGKSADLLIVNGDPATDIESVSDVYMVLQGGQIIVGPGRPE